MNISGNHLRRRIDTTALREGYGRALAELFDRLPDPIRDEIAAISHTREVRRDDILIPEGTKPAEIGYILDGTLGMLKRLADDRIHIIGLLVPTDLYGRPFGERTNYDVVALTNARVLGFDREPFEDIMRRVPEIERVFLSNLLDELDAAREWLLLLNGGKVSERLASFLLILVRRHSWPLPEGEVSPRVRIPIRRNDLAHYLGMRPESLSRAMHQLDGDGVLRLLDGDEIEVLDLARLVEASGQNLIFEDEFAL